MFRGARQGPTEVFKVCLLGFHEFYPSAFRPMHTNINNFWSPPLAEKDLITQVWLIEHLSGVFFWMIELNANMHIMSGDRYAREEPAPCCFLSSGLKNVGFWQLALWKVKREGAI